MAAYWIAMVDIADPARYQKYIELAPLAMSRFGGKILARGGRRIVLEGEARERIAIVEFPSIEHAEKFYNSAEYQEARKHRLGAGDVQVLAVVDGVLKNP